MKGFENLKKQNNEVRISSREIARITGKMHKDLLRSIRRMEAAWEKINGRKFTLVDYIDEKGEKRPMYLFTKKEFLYVISKYKDEVRAKLVIRWEELETERLKMTTKPVEQPKEQPVDRLGLAKFLERQADSGNFNPLYSQMIRTESVNVAAGRKLLPMPETPKQEASLTPSQVGKEVAKALGLKEPVTATMIGKISNAYNLKTDDNGIWREDFAPNGKQIPVFYYFKSTVQKVVEAAQKYIEQNPNSKLSRMKLSADIEKSLTEDIH